jgi:hypothetical protein
LGSRELLHPLQSLDGHTPPGLANAEA